MRGCVGEGLSMESSADSVGVEDDLSAFSGLGGRAKGGGGSGEGEVVVVGLENHEDPLVPAGGETAAVLIHSGTNGLTG